VVALAVVQVLPFAIELAKGKANWTFSVGRLAGAALVLAIFIVGGGVVALLIGDATVAKQAIAYGLGWQATVGGFIQGTRAVGSG
jgi:hypothetical protein